MPRFPILVGMAIGVAGCGTSFPKPMTSQDLIRFDTGEALVVYLGQPDASPAVCDRRARGPHQPHFDDDVRKLLVRGLVEGRIEPRIWRRCIDAALASSSPQDASLLLDAVGKGYRSLLHDDALENSVVRQKRLATMQSLYLERPSGINAHGPTVSPMFEELRRALDEHRLGPVATRFGLELLAAVDLERGLFGGRTVDAAMIDDLYARRDEATLRRFADRLPSKELRDEARRRVVRLAIAASPFPEVHAHQEQVEERVLQKGSNPIALAGAAPARAWLDPQTVRNVLVRQQVDRRTVTLFGYGGGKAGLSVLPEVPLRGALWIEIPGWSRPVTLCAPPNRIDPTPCIDTADVAVDHPLTYLDQEGAFHFVDTITANDAVGLASRSQDFVLPVRVGGHPVVSFEWPIHFEKPENLVFTGTSGDKGPDLEVTVQRTLQGRFVFTIDRSGTTYGAVVEAVDLPAFRVVSRGGYGTDGTTGADGWDGSDGQDGWSASCPSSSGTDGSSGGNGTDGQRGGDGGPAGDGGNIHVAVDCGAAGCAEVMTALRKIILSEGGTGGRGGAGGTGGRGGRGGNGGSGGTCTDGEGRTTSLSSGSSGFSGRSGWNGVSGSSGLDGRPGAVTMNFARP